MKLPPSVIISNFYNYHQLLLLPTEINTDCNYSQL